MAQRATSAAEPGDATGAPVLRLGKRSIRLSLTFGARHRAQSLPGGAPDGLDFRNPRKAFAAAVAWGWAMLPAEARADFTAPEDLADAITDEAGAKSLIDAVTAAIVASAPSPEKKN